MRQPVTRPQSVLYDAGMAASPPQGAPTLLDGKAAGDYRGKILGWGITFIVGVVGVILGIVIPNEGLLEVEISGPIGIIGLFALTRLIKAVTGRHQAIKREAAHGYYTVSERALHLHDREVDPASLWALDPESGAVRQQPSGQSAGSGSA